MKKTISGVLLSVVAFATLLFAADLADIDRFGSCQYCGMDRGKFAHSRMLVEYEDASFVGLCSLHCTAVELATTLDKTPLTIRVADYGSKSLIDAEKAIWVLGGNQNGVMTSRAKWAFADKADAEKFQAQHGGELVGFEDAVKAAYEDMYQDTRLIREKRKMRRMMQTK
jgi:hypothetical protein